VRRRIFDLGSEDETVAEFGVTKERMRQITKQAARAMAELVRENPRFSMMAMFAGRGAAAEKPVARIKVNEAAVSELLPVPRVRPEGRVKVSVVETGRPFPGTPVPAAPLPKRLPVPPMPVMPAHLAATPEARAV
jgi:RNA polymerase sigma-32 factor